MLANSPSVPSPVDFTKRLNLIFNLALVGLVGLAWLYVPQPGKVFAVKFLKLSNLELLLLFSGVLFVVNVYQQLGNIADHLLYWTRWLKNPRGSLVATSLVLGAMPVKGRTIMSAPVIAQIAKKHQLNSLAASMVDHLATHIYYLWFPLSGSLVLAIAAMQQSYLRFVGYLLPGILFLAAVVAYYSWKSGAAGVQLQPSTVRFSQAFNLTAPIVLLIVALALAELKEVPYAVVGGMLAFVALSLLFLRPTRVQLERALRAMDLQLILTLTLILLLAALTKELPLVKDWAKTALSSQLSIPILIVVGYLSGLTIGSSSTMVSAVFPILAPLATGLPNAYQISAITYAAQYAGYIASPAHPCCHYAASYFGNPYLKVWLRVSLYGAAASALIIAVALLRG